MPKYIKVSFLFCVVALLFGMTSRIAKRHSNRWLATLISGAGLVGLFLFPWVLILVRQGYVFRYNTLFSLGIVYAVVVSTAAAVAGRTLWRKIIIVMGSIIVVGFVYQQNIAAVGLHLINERDKFIANRIIDRLERHPQYASLDRIRPIYIFGRLDYQVTWPFGADPTRGLMGYSTVRASVFGEQPQRIRHLLEFLQADNATYIRSRDPARTDKAIAYARSHPVWPHPDSVAIIDDFVIIILSHQGRVFGKHPSENELGTP